MLRKLLSTYPKYTVYSPQYKAWASLEKDKLPIWGTVTKKDTSLDSVEKPKEKIWEGWIP
jgi:hypothetical protein